MSKIITIVAVIAFLYFVIHEATGFSLQSMLNWQSNTHGYLLGNFNVMPVMRVPVGV